MYFPRIDPVDGTLIDLQMTPLQIKNFRLQRPSRSDALWLRDTLNEHSSRYGTHFNLGKDSRLYLD